MPENGFESVSGLAVPQKLESLLSGTRERLLGAVRWRLAAMAETGLDAVEVLQEGCVRAVERWSRLVAEGKDPLAGLNDPYTWLYGQVMDRLAELQRVKRPRARGVGGDENLLVEWLASSKTSASAAFTRKERVKVVQDALASLDKKDRDVLNMKFIQGLSNSEIGDALRISGNAVSQCCGRALKKLKHLIPESIR